MSTRRLVTWIAFLAVFAMSARPSLDSDTWWHLRAGQWMVENRSLPQVDPFSYTRAGVEWEYPGWLAEAPMYALYQAFGPGGLNLWTAVMVTLAFAFVWLSLSGGAFLRAFVLVLAAAASGVYWAARPYLVTFVLAAAYLWILEGFRWNQSGVATGQIDSDSWSARKAARRLWWLPLLMVIWANSHGGFAIGFILFGVYWVSELAAYLLRPHAGAPLEFRNSKLFYLSLAGLLMVLAVCFNPSGPAMLVYPFKTISIGALGEYIQEWQSPDFHLRAAQPFIWLLLLTFGAVGASRRRLALSDFLLVSGLAYLSLLAWRNVAIFALAAPIVLTRHAAPLSTALARGYGLSLAPAAPTRRQGLFNRLLLILVALAALLKAAAALPLETNLAEIRKTMPVEAVGFIRETRPPGRLFNAYNWGGYLLWELPDYPVFIDGRTDLYDDALVDEWLRVVRAEAGWQDVLDQWDVRLLLLEPRMPIVRLLEEDGWDLLYQDDVALVYGR